jgi:hypothetical protein
MRTPARVRPFLRLVLILGLLLSSVGVPRFVPPAAADPGDTTNVAALVAEVMEHGSFLTPTVPDGESDSQAIGARGAIPGG